MGLSVCCCCLPCCSPTVCGIMFLYCVCMSVFFCSLMEKFRKTRKEKGSVQSLITVGGTEGGNVALPLWEHNAHQRHTLEPESKTGIKEIFFSRSQEVLVIIQWSWKKAYIYLYIWGKYHSWPYIDDWVVPLKLECNLCCHRPLLVTTWSLFDASVCVWISIHCHRPYL